MIDNVGVHKTHCCKLHGCKYGREEDCPVTTGRVAQEYLCEDCTQDGIDTMDILNQVLSGLENRNNTQEYRDGKYRGNRGWH